MTNRTGRPAPRARVARFISALLTAAGAGLLLVAGLLQGYGSYAQWRWERAQLLPAPVVEPLPVTPEPAAQPTETPPPSPEPTPSQAPIPSADATAIPTAAAPLQPASTAAPISTETPRPQPASTAAPISTETLRPQPTSTAAPISTETLRPQPASTAAPTSTETPRPQPTATPPPPQPSDPGRLLIPKLKVNTAIVTVPVINGQWDVSKIVYDVGLLEGTGFPGRPGNAAISGHVTLRGRGDGPFRWLEKLAPGDEITIQQGETSYTFRVRSTSIVLPTDVTVLAPTVDSTVTLITCTNWDFLKADYTHRLIVSAALVKERTTTSPAQ